MIANITKPTLLLDKQKCLSNIQKMAKKANNAKISFRPHFKTHQSIEVGNWYRDFGVSKITVSSFDMASHFIKADWDDVLIAFPFNIREIDRLNELSSSSKISILIDNIEVLQFLTKLNHRISFYIDIDTGYGRTGIPTDDTDTITEIITKSQRIKNLVFCGFYCHAGHSYKTKEKKEKDEIHKKALADLNSLKIMYNKYSPIALYGDTPNCSIQTSFNGIDEITPGNFVFYDLFQYSIGSCTENEIAVAMACPIVGKYKKRNEVVIHGGAVHFSKENVIINDMPVFGKLTQLRTHYWEAPKHNSHITSLSQEHGIVTVNSEEISNIHIGDLFYVLPVHSCLTANLMKSYTILDGQYF